MNRIWTIWILVLYYFCFIASMEQSTGVSTEHSSDMSTKAVTNTPKLIKQQRILRGFECDPKDYPYYVLIMEKIKTTLYKSCGGSLISPLMVLTACHCVDLRYPQYAGVMMDTEFQQIRAVSHYHMHPDFKNTTMDNDIAVFVLKEPMDRPKDKDVYSKLPRIDLAGDIRDFCENALVMGYGKTESSIDSHNLQCVILPVISSADCETYYGNMVFKSDFCTLSTEGKDACQGDSGGPILCQEVQVGIVSWGYKCGKINKPGVYVRVDKYLEFLEGIHIKEEKTPRASGASIQHLTISGHFITVFILFALIKVIV